MPREHSLLNQHVVINGCRIAAGVHGSGIPLVLVHGTPAHTVIWQALVPLWVDAGFQVYLYDLPGYGASERPLQADTSVAAQVAFLHDLLDHWQLEKTHLFGHDIGGAIALRLALDEPQRLLTLTVADAPCYDSWPSPTWRDMRDRYAEYALTPASEHRSTMTRQLKMAVFNKPLMAGERLEQFLAPLCGTLGQASFYQHQVAHYNACYTADFAERLPQLRLPVQILWGADDEWQPVHYARRLQHDIPGSTLHIYQHAGHFLMEDIPQPVAAQVIAFVNQSTRR